MIRFLEDDSIQQVKKEEEMDYYYEDQAQFLPYLPYENSNLDYIMAILLGMSLEEIDWIAHRDPMRFETLVVKTLRKIRREKAKHRLNREYVIPQLQDIKKKRGRKPIKQENYESDQQVGDKKTVQMIRNRISAQNSRDRKKAYVKQLEQETQIQEDDNDELRQIVENMRGHNTEISMQNQSIQQCIEIFLKLCKKSKNKAMVELGQQLQQIQQDSDTDEIGKKVKVQ